MTTAASEVIRWPDTSAHGFELRVAPGEVSGVTNVVVISRVGYDDSVELRLRSLGFTRSDERARLERSAAGISLKSLKAAFPETVLRDHSRQELDAPNNPWLLTEGAMVVHALAGATVVESAYAVDPADDDEIEEADELENSQGAEDEDEPEDIAEDHGEDVDGDSGDGDDDVQALERRASRTRSGSKSLDDFGEKIGGARKDLASAVRRGWLRVEDIKGWTSTERATLVTKAKVWRTPDYRALIEGGMSRGAAFCLSEIRAGILSAPKYAADEEAYVRAVGGLAERLADVRSDEDLAEALRPYLVVKTGTTQFASGSVGRYETVDVSEMGSDLNRFWRRQKRYGYSIVGHQYGIRDAFPRRDESTLFATCARRVPANWPGVQTGGKGRSRLASGREEIRPMLRGIVRKGPEHRPGNRDVVEQDFARVFGFRAGEFGNWLSAKDRQQSLNAAFDAFCDLADMLNIPRCAVSLGGTLAIAFGARGTGGKGAGAAHYEPGRRVINLTKMAGAGTLAHEWAHALDHFLADRGVPRFVSEGARTNVLAYSRVRPYLSHAVAQTDARYWRGTGRLREAVADLWQTMTSRTLSREDMMANRRARAESASANLASWVGLFGGRAGAVCDGRVDWRGVSAENRSQIEKASSKVLVAMRAALLAIEAPLSVSGDYYGRFRSCIQDVRAEVCALNQVVNKASFGSLVTRMTPAYDKRFQRAIDYCWSAHADCDGLEGGVVPVVRDRSVFARDAAQLDEWFHKTNPYYCRPTELFARAFEATIADWLQQDGRQCDYLAFGTDGVVAPVEKPGGATATDRGVSAFPQGAERVAIAAAFKAMAAELPVSEMTPQSVGPDETWGDAWLAAASTGAGGAGRRARGPSV